MRLLGMLLACGLIVGCTTSNPGSTADQLTFGSPTAAPASTSNPTEDGAHDLAATTAEAVTTAALIPTPAGPSTSGTLLSTRYPGLLSEGELPLTIYLPPGYDWTPGLLPAVYLLHGIDYDERQWVEIGVHRQLEARINAGDWEPLLLIMPRMPDPLLRSTDGGPDSYEVEFLNGLIPYVERNFRVDPRRRALAGISRGGVWALEIALRHPEDFRGVAALSPALHMNFPRPQYDPSVIVEQASRLPSVIYLDAGEGEPRTRTAVLEFSELLLELGVGHTLMLGEGGHDQESWTQVAPAALAALVAGFAP